MNNLSLIAAKIYIPYICREENQIDMNIKKGIILVALFFMIITATAQNNISSNNQSMNNKTSTIRLLYPQWQGGGTIADFVTELPPTDAYQGYYLGAQLLTFLAPESSCPTVEVPVSLDIKDRAEENGVISYRAILRQTQTALEKLNQNNPDKIVTLGGECSVSVVPFTYLAAKYPDDVAIVWIDAHPDLTCPAKDTKDITPWR